MTGACMDPVVKQSIQALFNVHGVKCLSGSWLKENKHNTLYSKTTMHTLERFAEEKNVLQEYLCHRNSLHAAGRAKIVENRGDIVWDAKKLHNVTVEIINKYSYIPPIEFLRANGHSTYHNAVRKYGKTMDDMRKQYNVTQTSDNRSLDGQVWLSLPETCL